MNNQKKRILVTISYSFSIRYLCRTGLLCRLKDFCEPVIAITWNEKEFIEELKQDGFEVHVIPESKMGTHYTALRKKMNIWFEHFILKSPSIKIERDYTDQFLSKRKKIIRNARILYNTLKFYLPGYTKNLFRLERKMLLSDTNYGLFSQLVDQLQIDAVLSITPFHKQEDILLRVCNDKHKYMITAILSFDNITKRGWIPVEYDIYMVWNSDNKEQLNRIYPFTKNKAVHITGAPQFDFYFDENNLLPVDAWKKLTGIPVAANRKIILYAGGPKALFPHEPVFLQHIDEAINSGAIKEAPLVLFRCHPIDDIERWKNAVGNSRNIVFDHSWTGKEKRGYTNITECDIKKLCSTLCYTDVHINLCSTMTIDGSAFCKPQIAPAYATVEKNNLLRRMYEQEHFVPVVETEGLLIARSKEELIQHINNALQEPGRYAAKSKEILSKIITYTDGLCTKKVAGVIETSLSQITK